MLRLNWIALLLCFSQQGFAGWVQDPSRIRLLGFCAQLDQKVLSFDEQGRLLIDLSALPPLSMEKRKIVCQIKIPLLPGSSVIAGAFRLEAEYQAGDVSRLLSTLRVSQSGKIGEAKIWTLDDSSSPVEVWSEEFSFPNDKQAEQELKLTWTHDLQKGKATRDTNAQASPSMQLKLLILSARPSPGENSPIEPIVFHPFSR